MILILATVGISIIVAVLIVLRIGAAVFVQRLRDAGFRPARRGDRILIHRDGLWVTPIDPFRREQWPC